MILYYKNSKIGQIWVEKFEKLPNHGCDEISKTPLVRAWKRTLFLEIICSFFGEGKKCPAALNKNAIQTVFLRMSSKLQTMST